MPIATTSAATRWWTWAGPKSIALCNSFTTSTLALIIAAASVAVGIMYIKSLPIEFIQTTCSVFGDMSNQTSTSGIDGRSGLTVYNSSVELASYWATAYFCRAWELAETSCNRGDSKKLQQAAPQQAAPTILVKSSEKHQSKNPFQKLHRFFSKHNAQSPDERLSALEQFPNVFPQRLVLTEQQRNLIRALSLRVQSNIPHFYNRAAHVPWGGPGGPKWYYPVGSKHFGKQGDNALEGKRLLYAYLRTMKWPANLHFKFPTKLCAKGCDADVAIAHTLEFREKYKPWYITPTAMNENRDGFIYHRGYSPAVNKEGKLAIVWYRPGLHKIENVPSYIRAMVHTLERAVADSLRATHNRDGKVNVVIDLHGLSFSMIPKLSEVKLILQILQGHLPATMGTVFLLNVSPAAEVACSLFKPFLTKSARKKIFIVPHDPEKKQKMLHSVIEEEYIPNWLGGPDNFKFDAAKYYPQNHRFSDKDGSDYLQTLSYLALRK